MGRERMSGNYGIELQVALSMVKDASRKIIEHQDNRRAVQVGLEFKAEIDDIANKVFLEKIGKEFPADQILTEESVKELGFPKDPLARIWVIDPLDGTTNFLNRARAYSSILGFIEGGEIKVGVVALPATGELFWATLGGGAYYAKGNDKPKRIRVNEVSELSRAAIILDPGYHPKIIDVIAENFQSMRQKVGNIGLLNANGYTLALIAKGEYSALVHFWSKIWEVGGFVVVEEAGGIITDFDGNKPKLDMATDLGFEFVAANKILHPQVLELIKFRSNR